MADVKAQPGALDARLAHVSSAVEDQWIGLEMSDVQDFLHQCGESLRGLVDSLQVMPLLAGLELQMQEGVGVTPNERQRCSELVADGGDESFAQLLERSNRRDVTQDRRRTNATTRLAGRAGVAPGDANYRA